MWKPSFLLIVLFSTSHLHAQGILGFNDVNATKEVDLEKQFDTQLNPKDQDEWMQYLSSHPHHVGSPHDKANAEYIANLFRSWGWQTEIVTYRPLFPTPKTRVLEIVGNKNYKPKLQEATLPEDKTSGQKSEQLPTYNAYSADGDVTAELVFVNRGVPADYEELERLGVDVKGKIVIAKYGGSWRGIKPKVAYEHGAIGCIIYSDPRDDGYFQGDVYPKGPYRPEQGVQRGSVMDMPVHPGDPLPPGWGAVKGARRIDRKDSDVIMKIPVLPISYGDALPLLKALEGPVAPEAWRGALPITYHVGSGPAKVHLKLSFDWSLHTLYDVIATIPGSTYPDQWVIQGNHHDGWVNGADDPISGLVAELEEARALGDLLKQGWHPKRTIILCCWDGEEPALLGSTEWVETHMDELNQKAVAYLNSDSNGKGRLGMSGSHTLEHFMNEVARDIKDPKGDKSLWETARERQAGGGRRGRETPMTDEERKDLNSRPDIRIGAMGSGSDYTPFIQHGGIASMNTGFGGEGGGGVYHSIYDSFAWYTRFGDPTFEHGRALAQVNGTIVVRLADADVLPFEFTDLAETVGRYVDELDKMSRKVGPKKEINFNPLMTATRSLV